MRTCHFFPLLFAAIALCPPRSTGGDEPDAQLAARFVDSVQRAAKKLDDIQCRVKCKATSKTSGVSAADKSHTQDAEIALRPGMGLVKRQDARGTSMAVKNSEYSFGIIRSGGNTRVLGDGTPGFTARTFDRTHEEVRRLVLSAYHVAEWPLSNLVSSEGFTVTRISEDNDRVEIDFEHHSTDGDSIADISNGHLVCVPSQNWAISEYEMTMRRGSDGPTVTLEGTNELGEVVNGILIPQKTTLLIVRPHKKNFQRVVTTFELLEKAAPKAHFYLAHYGQPEPSR